MKFPAASIGTFDGVHLGHRSVFDTLLKYSKERDLEPVAITFDRHPLELIDPSRAPMALTTRSRKEKLIMDLGVRPVVMKFDEKLRSTTAADWLSYLHDELGVRLLVVGYDTTFGCDGLNLSIEDYQKLGKERGIEIVTAPEIKKISSSAIRKAIASGDVETAREMLGRPYSITGPVVKGNSLGHTLGFPTANLDVPKDVAVPKPGVYAAVVKLKNGEKHPAMVNIGVRPSVMRGSEPVIEAHILNWKGDLYGQPVTIRFHKRLRDEEKFPSIEALKRQLAADREQVMDMSSRGLNV